MSAQIVLLPPAPDKPETNYPGHVTIGYYIKTAELSQQRADRLKRLECRIGLIANRSIELRKIAFALSAHNTPLCKKLELELERIADIIETIATTS